MTNIILTSKCICVLIYALSINIKDMIILNLSNAATFYGVTINSIILYIKKITACGKNNSKYFDVAAKITLKYPFRNSLILPSFIFRELFDKISTYGYFLVNII